MEGAEKHREDEHDVAHTVGRRACSAKRSTNSAVAPGLMDKSPHLMFIFPSLNTEYRKWTCIGCDLELNHIHWYQDIL